jgi:hypothetical protein
VQKKKLLPIYKWKWGQQTLWNVPGDLTSIAGIYALLLEVSYYSLPLFCYYLKHHCTLKIRNLVPLASRVLEHIAEWISARFHTLVPLAHSLQGRTDVLDVI